MNINFIFTEIIDDLNETRHILRTGSDFGRCPQSSLPPLNVKTCKNIKMISIGGGVIWLESTFLCLFIFKLNDFKFLFMKHQHRVV